jgi:UDP-N-acetylglucosamine acyltransferase
MSRDIHSTAIVSSKAEIGEDVAIGPHTIVEGDVVIGDGCRIRNNVLIANGARLGKNVHVYTGAVIATRPQDLKFGGEKTLARIGDNTVLREYVTFNRGTKAHGESSVGKDSLLMAYVHVAHDCILGDKVIVSNGVQMAGHVEIDEQTVIGGMVPIHQFTKLGAHVMVGGGFRVVQDVVPYALVAGYPTRISGVNAIGLKRRGFSPESIKAIRQAYKHLFYSDLNTSQAVERITSEMEITPEVQLILDFIERSNRGLIKAR